MTQPSIFNSTTPRFSLPLLFAGQAQKEFFVNEAHVLIDVLMHMSVKGLASTPPSAPAEGECWLVDATPVGEWAGHIDSIAFFAAGAWSFLNPVPGMRVFNISQGQYHLFDGKWNASGAVAIPTGGATVDIEARQTIEGLLSALQSQGILPSS